MDGAPFFPHLPFVDFVWTTLRQVGGIYEAQVTTRVSLGANAALAFTAKVTVEWLWIVKSDKYV